MSLELNHIILHSINQDGEQLACLPRESELPLTRPAQEMVSEIHRIYNAKGGKAFGLFRAPEQEADETAVSDFRSRLQAYLQGEAGFVEFTQKAARMLIDEINKYEFAETGILLFAHYQYVANDFLFVALLPHRESVSVNERLEVEPGHYIDLGRLQLAARIDLTSWQRDPDHRRYVSFIKGRAGRKVADFFLDFLGCEEGVDTREQTANLMAAVDEFCSVSELEPEERQEVKKQISKYCVEQTKAGEEIDLKDLADQVADNSEVDFYTLANEQYGIEEHFPVEATGMRKLIKFVGQGGGISLSFDQHLLGERVQYDPASDTLTIKGTPPNLRDQLQRYVSGSE